jgi:hypothetical protein
VLEPEQSEADQGQPNFGVEDHARIPRRKIVRSNYLEYVVASRQLPCVAKLESCLGRFGKPLIHFFLVGEQLLNARALLHALEMRHDVREA